MGAIAKGTIGYKRLDLPNDKSIAIGAKTLKFAHQFSAAGLTDIDLTALSAPSSMTSLGFLNPSASDLTNANLYLLSNNLQLVSTINGVLMGTISYDVVSN